MYRQWEQHFCLRHCFCDVTKGTNNFKLGHSTLEQLWLRPPTDHLNASHPNVRDANRASLFKLGAANRGLIPKSYKLVFFWMLNWTRPSHHIKDRNAVPLEETMKCALLDLAVVCRKSPCRDQTALAKTSRAFWGKHSRSSTSCLLRSGAPHLWL